jgi:hypothetical protein
VSLRKLICSSDNLRQRLIRTITGDCNYSHLLQEEDVEVLWNERIELIMHNSSSGLSSENYDKIKHASDEIISQFGRFIAISDHSPFVEHWRRADAYIMCCENTNPVDTSKLHDFVNAYGAADEQMQIIQKCADNLTTGQRACNTSLEEVAMSQWLTET